MAWGRCERKIGLGNSGRFGSVSVLGVCLFWECVCMEIAVGGRFFVGFVVG